MVFRTAKAVKVWSCENLSAYGRWRLLIVQKKSLGITNLMVLNMYVSFVAIQCKLYNCIYIMVMCVFSSANVHVIYLVQDLCSDIYLKVRWSSQVEGDTHSQCWLWWHHLSCDDSWLLFSDDMWRRSVHLCVSNVYTSTTGEGRGLHVPIHHMVDNEAGVGS